jgi:hypothetical protein
VKETAMPEDVTMPIQRIEDNVPILAVTGRTGR